ncbi:hypothetical protein [Caldalkalibacillus mannanilyticus]|uniref:hypothetical protein n=1 Tax=Caldalkalibacillus mannanilyticus TaxID=1418 RepID=UPI000A5904CA|nr:hypothetical protein [Caldalkalibacillus mannanilyticus]
MEDIEDESKEKMDHNGLVYVSLIIVGYYTYAYLVMDRSGHVSHEETENMDHHPEQDEGGDEQGGHDHGQEESHSDHATHASGASEVIPKLNYDGQKLSIFFQNLEGQLVTELKMNHERLVHLILISDDLEEYLHLHPTAVGDGTFQVEVELATGSYKLFADILPVGYKYEVEGIPLVVGHDHGKQEPQLVTGRELIQQIEGYKVSLLPFSMKKGEPIKLEFVIEGGTPEPYLGALGHVVIVNESLEEFLHVHPSSKNSTIFDTSFPNTGFYKIFAEFQFQGKVYAFPFVIQIES